MSAYSCRSSVTDDPTRRRARLEEVGSLLVLVGFLVVVGLTVGATVGGRTHGELPSPESPRKPAAQGPQVLTVVVQLVRCSAVHTVSGTRVQLTLLAMAPTTLSSCAASAGDAPAPDRELPTLLDSAEGSTALALTVTVSVMSAELR